MPLQIVNADMGGLGSPVQLIQAQYTSFAGGIGGSNQMSIANVVPTNTQGAQVLAQAITPVSPTDNVLVQFACAATLGAIGNMVFALFRGSTCIQARIFSCYHDGNPVAVYLDVLDSPASTAPQTYSVRCSGSGGTALYINEYYTHFFGGVEKATLTLTEIRA